MTTSTSPIVSTEAILAIAGLAVGVAAMLALRALRRRASEPAAAPREPAPACDGAGRSTGASSTNPVVAPAGASGPMARPPRPTGARRRPRPADPIEVLLAEDNDVNALVLTRHLEKLGCRVTRAATGADAVAAAAKGAFEIVFMDWRMPEMDGLEAIRRIRRIEAHADVPIVAVTANALPGDRETCLQAGADAYLTKPVDGSLLRTTLARFVPGAGEPDAAATASDPAAR